MQMALSAFRKSDNKQLFFHDSKSMDEYMAANGGADAYDFVGIDEVPYFERFNIIDTDETRKTFTQFANRLNLDTKGLELNEIYGCESEDMQADGTEERVEKAFHRMKKVYQLNEETGAVEETDDDPALVSMQKSFIKDETFFKSLMEHASEDEKEKVAAIFKKKKLSINCLQKYFDRRLEMDPEPFLKTYSSYDDMKKDLAKFNKTADGSFIHRFESAMEEAIHKVFEKQITVDDNGDIFDEVGNKIGHTDNKDKIPDTSDFFANQQNDTNNEDDDNQDN